MIYDEIMIPATRSPFFPNLIGITPVLKSKITFRFSLGFPPCLRTTCPRWSQLLLPSSSRYPTPFSCLSINSKLVWFYFFYLLKSAQCHRPVYQSICRAKPIHYLLMSVECLPILDYRPPLIKPYRSPPKRFKVHLCYQLANIANLLCFSSYSN